MPMVNTLNKDLEYRDVRGHSTSLSVRRLLCLATCDCCGGMKWFKRCDGVLATVVV